MQSRNLLPENKFILLNKIAEIRLDRNFDLCKLTPFNFKKKMYKQLILIDFKISYTLDNEVYPIKNDLTDNINTF